MNAPRISIVDDDELYREYLVTMLTSRGYRVDEYDSGAHLMEAIGQGYVPQVVLLDVLMPDMNGLETLRLLRAAQPKVQVVMLSGDQMPATIVTAVRSGAFDYVVKVHDAVMGDAAIENAIVSACDRIALEAEVARLSEGQIVDSGDNNVAPWGTGGAMQSVLRMMDRVADSDVAVLISGETGVGKEVVAREMHRRSRRRNRPFVKVNCAAMPSELLESELFGHERGAFTGAQAARLGKFEFADGGTLMLDEIGEMPAALQAKLLHVLQDGEFTKLGSNRPVRVDTRIIAATNRDLQSMIRAGQFREDLYYRLQVIEIRVPALRERRDEIGPLVDFFMRRYFSRYGRKPVRMSPELRQILTVYSWPGNVRELENAVKRFVILNDEALVMAELQRAPGGHNDATSGASSSDDVRSAAPSYQDFPVDVPVTAGKLPDLARAAAATAEREAIVRALEKFRWNRRKAAGSLGVSYKTLLNKMKACGISGADEPDDDVETPDGSTV